MEEYIAKRLEVLGRVREISWRSYSNAAFLCINDEEAFRSIFETRFEDFHRRVREMQEALKDIDDICRDEKDVGF